MDARKALQGLQSGDMFMLAAALDMDQQLVLVMPEDEDRILTGRVGRVVISCIQEDETGHHVLQLHVLDSEHDAAMEFTRRLTSIQAMRAGALATGKGPYPLWVDGVLTPVPEATTDQLIAMLQAATARARALIEVPDDLSSLQP